MDMFINMRQFLAIFQTFQLLLHFDQLFSSNLQSGDNAPIINRIDYLSEDVPCSKNGERVTEIDIFEKPGNKKRDKRVTLMVQ